MKFSPLALLSCLIVCIASQDSINDTGEIIRRQVFNKDDLRQALGDAAKKGRKVLLSCESDTCPFSRIASKSVFNSLRSSAIPNLMVIKIKL